ncbi:MAG: DUF86 domain-containing protein [Bacteroidales bacterium]|nr:DUF86 domain-containing protein [Bacteroidales bacterium]
MHPDIMIWLKDIELSIKEIHLFLPRNKTYTAFQKDLKTRKAIERNIEIIGEAMKRIIEIYPDIQIKDPRRIIDTRNRIIHGYDSVSADVIWLIVTRDLPILEKEVEGFLK